MPTQHGNAVDTAPPADQRHPSGSTAREPCRPLAGAAPACRWCHWHRHRRWGRPRCHCRNYRRQCVAGLGRTARQVEAMQCARSSWRRRVVRCPLRCCTPTAYRSIVREHPENLLDTAGARRDERFGDRLARRHSEDPRLTYAADVDGAMLLEVRLSGKMPVPGIEMSTGAAAVAGAAVWRIDRCASSLPEAPNRGMSLRACPAISNSSPWREPLPRFVVSRNNRRAPYATQVAGPRRIIC